MSTQQPPVQWQAQAVGFTAFFAAATEISACMDWWPRIVGSAPENLSLLQGTTLQAAGPYGQGTLNLRVATALEPRADLLISSVVPPGTQLPTALTVGPAQDAMRLCQGLVHKWFTLQVPVRRVGISAALVSSVEDRAAGYRTLGRMLPDVRLDAENSSDFLYQINRPVRSRVTNIVVNRLSKWSVMTQIPLQISVAVPLSGGAPITQVTPGAEGSQFVRLDLDINTDPRNSETLDPRSLDDLTDELFAYGWRLAESGDIP